MKKIVSIVLAVSMLAVCVTGCKTTTRKQLKPVVLNEVAHSIFYAPQYAAIELGYFEDEGLDLTLVNGAGAVDQRQVEPFILKIPQFNGGILGSIEDRMSDFIQNHWLKLFPCGRFTAGHADGKHGYGENDAHDFFHRILLFCCFS